MRIAILSDIHSNLEALKAVMAAIAKEPDIQQIFCLGDVVGYGADPLGCLEIVQKQMTLCLAGNHDWAVAGKLDFEDFNEQAAQAVRWTQKQCAKKQLKYLGGLALTFQKSAFEGVHGTLNYPEEFYYLKDINDAADTFFLMKTSVCFVGHTHDPQILIHRDGITQIAKGASVSYQDKDKCIVNVGSVGQPRDGDPRAAFCLFDTKNNALEIHRVPYPVEIAQEKILKAGLPEYLAQRLAMGQ